MIPGRDDRQLFIGSLGKCVRALYRERFFYDGIPDNVDMGALEVAFEDGTTITLHTASDGQSVVATEGKLPQPVAFVMTEREGQPRCEWQRVSLTDIPDWAQLAGSQLVAVEAKVDVWVTSGAEVWSGWRLGFSTGAFVLYQNVGDEAKLYLSEWPVQEEAYRTVWRRVE